MNQIQNAKDISLKAEDISSSNILAHSFLQSIAVSFPGSKKNICIELPREGRENP